MWKEYAPGRLSVALVSSVERFDQILRGLTFDFDVAMFWYGRVLYPSQDALPAPPDDINSVTVGFVKRPEYHWEREFRLVWMDGRRPPCGRSFPIVVHDLVEQIVLSPAAEAADETLLRDLIARLAPGLSISRSGLS